MLKSQTRYYLHHHLGNIFWCQIIKWQEILKGDNYLYISGLKMTNRLYSRISSQVMNDVTKVLYYIVYLDHVINSLIFSYQLCFRYTRKDLTSTFTKTTMIFHSVRKIIIVKVFKTIIFFSYLSKKEKLFQ